MRTPIKAWNNSLSSFLSRTRTLNDSLYRLPSLNRYQDWANSNDGKALCAQAQLLLLETIAIWNDPQACSWDDADLMANVLTTQSFLEALTIDYMYRTNNSPPSGPFWDYLEANMDMPAAWEQLHKGWEDRSPAQPEAPNALRRILALTALCRVDVPYPLKDEPWNKTVWQDMQELKNHWGFQPNPLDAAHQTFVRGIEALPSSMEHFYAFAASNGVPQMSAPYLFENFSPMRDDGLRRFTNAETMTNWCSWLATLQKDQEAWKETRNRWPDLAVLVEVVSALEPPELVGPRVWELYHQKMQDTIQPMELENVTDLFGMQATA